jgi:hypothetical protein
VIVSALALLLTAGAAGRTATWTVVASPKVAEGELAAVSADSATDVWAVGNKFNVRTSHYRTLIEHFDGTASHVVRSRNPLSDDWLNGVVALAPNDVWAVGFATNTDWGSNRTLVEHWHGTSCKALHSPNLGNFSFFHRIAPDAGGGFWAAGAAYDEGIGSELPLMARWNGSTWTRVDAPLVGNEDYPRVAASSGGDAWLVGEADGPPPTYQNDPLVEHWDGSSWSAVTSPPADYLAGVVALSASDAWIVGDDAAKTLAQHWDGAAWSTVPAPNANDSPSSLNSLNAVALAPGTRTLWAVGAYDGDDNSTHPLILEAANA